MRLLIKKILKEELETLDNMISGGVNTAASKIKKKLVYNKNNKEDYILASTLVIESYNAQSKELYAILSSIKNRADKCGKTMEEMVLLPKQYSTWNYYNTLSSEEEKEQELNDRFENHIKNKNLNYFLGVVKAFKKSQVLPYNHYVTNELIKKYDSGNCGDNSICKSYKENKKSSKQIGEHTFWWADSHRCN